MNTIAVAPTRVGASIRPPRRLIGFWPASPALVLIIVFFVAPVLGLLLRSVLDPQPGLQNYVEVFASTTYLRVFVNTFTVAAIVTAVTLLLAFPLAWFLAVVPRFWAALLFAIIILSMWTNLLTRTYAWMVLLQRTGIINKTLMDWGLICLSAPADQQSGRGYRRHDLHHAALHGPAAAEHDAQPRPGDVPGGLAVRREPASGLPPRVPTPSRSRHWRQAC